MDDRDTIGYMMEGFAMLTTAKVLRLIANANFRPMDSYDRETFAGVDNFDALIHYSDEAREDYTIILDGEKAYLIDREGSEQMFYLGDNILA